MAGNIPVHRPLEIDRNEEESTYDTSSIGSGSHVTSLSESIRNYKYENGRRYHAYQEGTYVVPNDEEEQDRMDLFHHIYRLILDGELQLAPVVNPQRALDIGTGTGIWAIQFADENPSAQVIGTDLSPIQPPWVPPNCAFEVDNYEDPWVFNQPFDYIHGRELEGCVADEDKLFRQAYKHLKPGGYFEFDGAYGDFSSDDGTHEKAESWRLFANEIMAAANRFGKSFDNVPIWKEKMGQAGFINVREFIFKLPVGPWAKDKKLKGIGEYERTQQIIATESYMPALFTRVLSWSQSEMEVLLEKVKKDLTDRSLHMYLKVYFVYGQKPQKGQNPFDEGLLCT